MGVISDQLNLHILPVNTQGLAKDGRTLADASSPYILVFTILAVLPTPYFVSGHLGARFCKSNATSIQFSQGLCYNMFVSR